MSVTILNRSHVDKPIFRISFLKTLLIAEKRPLSTKAKNIHCHPIYKKKDPEVVENNNITQILETYQ